MKMMNVNDIKPDPDQPRRTFNEEKMEALRASMRTDGFRQQYPIIINGGNTIVDGERRWRAAKSVGIKEVPVEKKDGVTPAERLLYQLQSEGAELDFIERNKAWAKLWEISQNFDTMASLSRKLGVNINTFKGIIRDYEIYQQGLNKLSNQKVAATVSYETMVEVGSEDKELVEKAVKEKWSRDKARDIKQAIKDKPLRANQILSHDYSGSNWQEHLEIAKTGFSSDQIKKMEEVSKDHEAMMDVIQTLSDIVTYGLKMQWAMQKLGDKYKLLTPGKRAEHHAKVRTFLPFAVDYITEIEEYMIRNGELQRNQKLLK